MAAPRYAFRPRPPDPPAEIIDGWLIQVEGEADPVEDFCQEAKLQPDDVNLRRTRQALEAIFVAPRGQYPQIADRLHQHLTEGSLAVHFGYDPINPHSRTDRDQELQERVYQESLRYRWRRRREEKQALRPTEAEAVEKLRRAMERYLPVERLPHDLRALGVERLYSIEARDVQRLSTFIELSEHVSGQELQQAAIIDERRADDVLAFELCSREGYSTEHWKILTRAQLQLELNEHVMNMSDFAMGQWNAELARWADRR